MSNEVIYKTTTQVTLTGSGASLASNALAAPASVLGTSQHLNYPLGDFVLAGPWGASHAAGGSILLHARNLNIDGSGNESNPASDYQPNICGAFKVPSSNASHTTILYMLLQDVQLSPLGNVEYWIENKTNGAIGAGWTLKVTPKTRVPAP